MIKERTHTPEEDWEKFKMVHAGKNWIEQYEPVVSKYPQLRLYGWHKAIKWYCEESGYDYKGEDHNGRLGWLRPSFLPDLYLVCTDFIAAIEIENYSRWSKEKENSLMQWIYKMDEHEDVPIYIYRFDRYGNYQNLIYPDVEKDLQMAIDYTNSYEPTESDEREIMPPFTDGHKNTWNEHVLSGRLIEESLEQMCIAQEVLIDIQQGEKHDN
tara:strand:+ start:188 stop:823 length:636 start_codon:yes stop_codon:yes gene_type:complete